MSTICGLHRFRYLELSQNIVKIATFVFFLLLLEDFSSVLPVFVHLTVMSPRIQSLKDICPPFGPGSAPIFARISPLHSERFDLTAKKKYDIVWTFKYKAVKKTRLLTECPERSRLLRWLCIPRHTDTTSELPGGNAGTGAPDTAPMSGTFSGATRVEPWNMISYPTPDRFRGGISVFRPQILRRY